MADKTLRLYLEHIRDAIGLIEQYARGRQRRDLDREPMLRQAIERTIEIISEASRRVPQATKARHSEVPWREIATIGNILRHVYPALNRNIVWRIATEDVRPLATAVEELLAGVLRDRKVWRHAPEPALQWALPRSSRALPRRRAASSSMPGSFRIINRRGVEVLEVFRAGRWRYTRS